MNGPGDDLVTCAPFVPPESVYSNPLAVSGAHKDKRYWLQKFGDPSHPVIILYSGMPTGSAGSGLQIYPFLMLNYFVVVIEYPGTGNCRHQLFSLDELWRRTQLYVTELQPRPGEPVLLYGVSGGANAALWLASRLEAGCAGVVAVVGVAPGNSMAFRQGHSVFWHPLSFKTKMDLRSTPYSVLAKFMVNEYRRRAEALTVCDASWSDHLQLGAAPVTDGSQASAQEYFHDPELLAREWFGNGGPGAAPGYEERMGAVQERLIQHLAAMSASPGLQKAGELFCPEIYPEYISEYITHGVCGDEVLSKVLTLCLSLLSVLVCGLVSGCVCLTSSHCPWPR